MTFPYHLSLAIATYFFPIFNYEDLSPTNLFNFRYFLLLIFISTWTKVDELLQL